MSSVPSDGSPSDPRPYGSQDTGNTAASDSFRDSVGGDGSISIFVHTEFSTGSVTKIKVVA